VARIVFTEPSLLVVEGERDKTLFIRLRDHMGLERLQVHPLGGRHNLEQRLVAVRDGNGFKSAVRQLGIALDADVSPQDTLAEIQEALRTARLPVPEHPLKPTGNRPSSGAPQVTAMVIPDACTPGMLEDVCLAALADDWAVTCLDGYFECLAEKAPEGHPWPQGMGKRRLQALLASRSAYIEHVGEAAGRRNASEALWSWDHRAFAPLQQLLRLLTIAVPADPDD